MLRMMNNNWKRLMADKGYLILSVFLTICAVLAAIFFNNKLEAKSNIAVVQSTEAAEIASSPYFRITYLEKIPPMSLLMQNRYDAIVIRKDNESFEINTIKNDTIKEEIERFLNNPTDYKYMNPNVRKIGTNIIGYMMMFILLQGVLYSKLFAEDKEKHMLERVASSPIPFRSYLAGHGSFIGLLIFIPSFLVVAVAKIFGFTIGFSLFHYAMLIGIMSFLSVAYALFLNSFFCVADKANMIGSSTVMLTTILAGSFYSFSKDKTLFNDILHVLPQKDFINFADALEKGNMSAKISMQLSYIILLSLALFVVAVIKTRRDYVYK